MDEMASTAVGSLVSSSSVFSYQVYTFLSASRPHARSWRGIMRAEAQAEVRCSRGSVCKALHVSHCCNNLLLSILGPVIESTTAWSLTQWLGLALSMCPLCPFLLDALVEAVSETLGDIEPHDEVRLLSRIREVAHIVRHVRAEHEQHVVGLEERYLELDVAQAGLMSACEQVLIVAGAVGCFHAHS